MSFTNFTCSVGEEKKTELVYDTVIDGMTELMEQGCHTSAPSCECRPWQSVKQNSRNQDLYNTIHVHHVYKL